MLPVIHMLLHSHRDSSTSFEDKRYLKSKESTVEYEKPPAGVLHRPLIKCHVSQESPEKQVSHICIKIGVMNEELAPWLWRPQCLITCLFLDTQGSWWSDSNPNVWEDWEPLVQLSAQAEASASVPQLWGQKGWDIFPWCFFCLSKTINRYNGTHALRSRGGYLLYESESIDSMLVYRNALTVATRANS